MPPTPPRPAALTLFLDFDGTLTHADTLAALASIPYALRSGTRSPASRTPPLPPSQPPTGPPNPPSHSQEPPPFSHFSTTYFSALTAHTAAYHPPAAQRTTPALELAFLASQRGVEDASVRRVEAAGLFQGVRRGDVLSAAERMVRAGEVRVRKGWVEMVRGVGVGEGDRSGEEEGEVEGNKRGAEVYILSVNWSRAWIAAVLDADLRLYLSPSPATTVRDLGVHVVANELRGLDAPAGSCGRLDRWFGAAGGGLWTSADKGRVVREVLGGRRGGWSVYVGDSVGDLEGLLECDVGVCVRDGEMGRGQRELRDGLERVGVRCEWVGGWRGERGEGRRVWWAGGWGEVVESGVLEGGKGRGACGLRVGI
ncbi:hypothetical protein MMC27_001036 [Xylographa pallens]|nr:hypothetical protein [Xylographa pallens]